MQEPMVLTARLVLRVRLAMMVQSVRRVFRDHREFRASREIPATWDLRVRKEMSDPKDPRASKETLAQLVLRDLRESRGTRALMVLTEPMVLLAPPERLALKDLKVLWVPLVRKARRVMSEPRAFKESRVSLAQ